MLNMTALKISLENGKTATKNYAIGVAIIVAIQAFIGVYLTKTLAENPTVLESLEKAGIVIFILLSIYFYKTSKNEKNETKKIHYKTPPFVTGITLSSLNMFSIPFYSGTVFFLDAFQLFTYNITAVLLFVLGAFLGTVYILILYGKYAKFIQKKTGKMTKNIHLILAILTGFMALFTLIKIILQ